MFGYYKSNCAGSTAWTSLANFSWRFYTIWQHQANTLLAQMPFQRAEHSYAYIFTPVRLPVVGTSTCKYIYPRCWFLKACGPQHTSLLWNIQFGDCKEIRLVNSFLRSHETQCRAKCKVVIRDMPRSADGMKWVYGLPPMIYNLNDMNLMKGTRGLTEQGQIRTLSWGQAVTGLAKTLRELIPLSLLL